MQNKRGKRGSGHSARRSFAPNPNAFLNSVGKDERPSGLRSSQPVRPKASTQSATGAVGNMAHYFEGALVGESDEAHVVARKGITDKQCLRLFDQQAEYETLKYKRIDTVTGEITEGTYRRRAWQSDKTLLRRGNPFKADHYKREGVIREGANSRKYIETPKGESKMDVLLDEQAKQEPKVLAEDVYFDE